MSNSALSATVSETSYAKRNKGAARSGAAPFSGSALAGEDVAGQHASRPSVEQVDDQPDGVPDEEADESVLRQDNPQVGAAADRERAHRIKLRAAGPERQARPRLPQEPPACADRRQGEQCAGMCKTGR